MTPTFVLASLVSAGLFLTYGALCLFSDGMEAEFTRYGLRRFRRLTGALEMLGGAGLLVGLRVPAVGVLAAIGLAVLMVLGLLARLRVRDPFLELLPAAFLLVLNVLLALTGLELLPQG
jgi:hypothetical protein